MELFGLEGNLQPIQCHPLGHLPLSQAAPSPIQPGLEHFQGWGNHSFSGHPVPGPPHSHKEKFLKYIQGSPRYQLVTSTCKKTSTYYLPNSVFGKQLLSTDIQCKVKYHHKYFYRRSVASAIKLYSYLTCLKQN